MSAVLPKTIEHVFAITIKSQSARSDRNGCNMGVWFPKGIAAEVGTIWGWQQVEGMLRYSLQIILAFYLNLSGFARKQFTTDSIINFNCQNVFFF